MKLAHLTFTTHPGSAHCAVCDLRSTMPLDAVSHDSKSLQPRASLRLSHRISVRKGKFSFVMLTVARAFALWHRHGLAIGLPQDRLTRYVTPAQPKRAVRARKATTS